MILGNTVDNSTNNFQVFAEELRISRTVQNDACVWERITVRLFVAILILGLIFYHLNR